MPNRIIKESIRTSKKVNALSDFQFRVWLYLITYVDDYGRGSADPELLKGLVFPRRKTVTEKQIQDALTVLADNGMITPYEVDGDPYLCFPNWSDHQRVQTKRAKFPAPPSIETTGIPPKSADVHGGSREVTVTHGESLLESNPNPNPIQSESNPAAAHEVEADQDHFSSVLAEFSRLLNPTPSAASVSALEGFTEKLGADVCIHAIQTAADANKRGWSYLKAILSRYERENLRTLADVLSAEEAYNRRKSASQSPTAQTSDHVDTVDDWKGFFTGGKPS